MRPFLFVLLVLTLLLVACSAPRPPAYSVAMFPPSARPQGERDGRAGVIRLHPRLLEDTALIRHVCAHEMGHAIGVPHGPPGTIMAAGHAAGEPLIDHLTPEEVRAARPQAGPIRLTPLPQVPPRIVNGLRWGAGLWNGALKRPVFEVCPAADGG